MLTLDPSPIRYVAGQPVSHVREPHGRPWLRWPSPRGAARACGVKVIDPGETVVFG